MTDAAATSHPEETASAPLKRRDYASLSVAANGGSDKDAQVASRKRLFLEHLEQNGNVRAASRFAGWASYASPRYHRENDPEFKAAWDEALAVAVAALEVEARNRAIHGTGEPVIFQGVQQYRRNAQGEIIHDPVTGEPIPLVIMKKSDRLMEVLLRAHNPEVYGEKVKHDHTVKGGVLVLGSTPVLKAADGRELSPEEAFELEVDAHQSRHRLAAPDPTSKDTIEDAVLVEEPTTVDQVDDEFERALA